MTRLKQLLIRANVGLIDLREVLGIAKFLEEERVDKVPHAHLNALVGIDLGRFITGKELDELPAGFEFLGVGDSGGNRPHPGVDFVCVPRGPSGNLSHTNHAR